MWCGIQWTELTVDHEDVFALQSPINLLWRVRAHRAMYELALRSVKGKQELVKITAVFLHQIVSTSHLEWHSWN